MSASLTILCAAGAVAVLLLTLSALGVIPERYRVVVIATVVGVLSLGGIPLYRRLKKNQLRPNPQSLEELGELTDAEVEVLDDTIDIVIEGAKENVQEIREILADIDTREKASTVLGSDDPDSGSLSRAKLREMRARSRKVQGVP